LELTQWGSAITGAAFSALMFAGMLAFDPLGWMSGGDVKIPAVAFLWTGLSRALRLAILLALFSGAYASAAKLGWAKSQITPAGRHRIPFAPSVAGAFIGTFMLKALKLA
jgi:prepilin peptidase CpaA